MVTGLLRNVEAKERDPAVADRVNMMDRKRRLQVQLYHMSTMTCKEGYPSWWCDEFSVPDSRHRNR